MTAADDPEVDWEAVEMAEVAEQRQWEDHRDALAAAEARGVERGRTEAAEAIAAHRDKFWPKDDRLDSARARVRRHLNIAIQVAGPPMTLSEVIAALKAHPEAAEGDDRADTQ